MADKLRIALQSIFNRTQELLPPFLHMQNFCTDASKQLEVVTCHYYYLGVIDPRFHSPLSFLNKRRITSTNPFVHDQDFVLD